MAYSSTNIYNTNYLPTAPPPSYFAPGGVNPGGNMGGNPDIKSASNVYQPVIKSSPTPFTALPILNAKNQALLDMLNKSAPELAQKALELDIPTTIEANGLHEHECRIALIVDASSSMQDEHQFYMNPNDGSSEIQELIKRFMTLAAFLDRDQQVDVFFFGRSFSRISDTVYDYENVVSSGLHQLGGSLQPATNYAVAVDSVLEYYFGDKYHTRQSKNMHIFCAMLTDGECNEVYQQQTIEHLARAVQYPIFFKILALSGNQPNPDFKFLEDLDRSDRHVSQFEIIKKPSDLTMAKLLHGYRDYVEFRNLIMGNRIKGGDSNNCCVVL